MKGGFIYLAAVIYWHSKAILSYKVSNIMDAALSVNVLEDAISKYGKLKIFNLDQGSQYTSRQHMKLLSENGIEISMNGRERCIDNIAI